MTYQTKVCKKKQNPVKYEKSSKMESSKTLSPLKLLLIANFTLLTLPISFSQSIERLEVWGERLDQELLLNHNFIDRDFILENSFGRREDLFRYTPGVDAHNERGINDRIIIRGLENRHLERINGARNRFSGGHIYNPLLDPFLTGAIKLNSGATASSSGAGAIGGQLLQETVKPKSLLGYDHSKFIAQTQTGTNVSHGVGVLGAYRLSDSLSISAGHVNRELQDKKLSDNQRMAYSAMKTHSSLIKSEFHYNNLNSDTALIYREDNSLLPLNPEAQANEFGKNFLSDSTRRQLLLSNNSSYSLNNHLLESHLSYQTQKLQKTHLGNNTIDDRDIKTIQGNISNNYTWYQSTQRNFKVSSYHQLEYYIETIEGRRNTHDNIPGFPTGEAQEHSHHHRLQLFYQRYTFYAGGRFYHYKSERDRNDQEQKYQGFLPESGVKIDITPSLSLGAHYAEAYAHPTLSQLYPEGSHFPGNFYIANQNLDPESAKNLEFNMTWAPQSMLFKLSAYRNKAKDFISSEITMTTTQFKNIDSVTTQGIEGSVFADVNNFTLGISFDFHKHLNGETGEYLKNQRGHRSNFLLDYHVSDSLKISTNTRYFFSQKRVSEGLPQPDSFYLFDLRLNYKTSLMQAPTTLGLQVNNTFNKTHFFPGTSFAGPGREYFLSATIEI